MVDYGVNVIRQPSGVQAPRTARSALSVFVGVAPMANATNPAKPNEVVMCQTMSEFESRFGVSNDYLTYRLNGAAWLLFEVMRVRPVIFCSVLDVDKPAHTASKMRNVDLTQRFGFARETVITDFGVIPAMLQARLTDTGGLPIGSPLVQGEDFVLGVDGAGYTTIKAVMGGAIFALDGIQETVTVALDYDCVNPAGVTNLDIIGSGSSGLSTGLRTISRVFPRLREVPALVMAPGFSDAAVIAALTGACRDINSVFQANCIADIDSTATGARTYDQVVDFKFKAGMTDDRLLACWPCARFGDRIIHMSTVMAGLANVADAENNAPAEILSNLLINCNGFCLEDGTPVELSLDEANVLRGNGVATGLFWDGGFRSWGAYTAAWPANTDPAYSFFNISRHMSWHANHLVLTYFQNVDMDYSRDNIENVLDTENDFLRSLHARGITPISSIAYPPEYNSDGDLLLGRMVFLVLLADYIPTQQINFLQRFNFQALRDEILGGAA